MANFSALKTAIQNAIRQNGNEEITGDVLQQILLSVVNTMGDGAINTIEQNLSGETLARQSADNTLQSNINSEALARGNADTQLQNAINAIKANIDNGYVYAGIATPSSTPVSGKVFYIATDAGTYTNFGGQVLTQGINILRYNGSAWSNQQLIGIDDEPTAESENLMKSCGVVDYVKELIYDGADNTIVYQNINVKAGETYLVIPFAENWAVAYNSKTYNVRAYSIESGSSTLYFVQIPAQSSSIYSPIYPYIATIPEGNTNIRIGIRAAAGTTVKVNLYPVSTYKSLYREISNLCDLSVLVNDGFNFYDGKQLVFFGSDRVSMYFASKQNLNKVTYTKANAVFEIGNQTYRIYYIDPDNLPSGETASWEDIVSYVDVNDSIHFKDIGRRKIPFAIFREAYGLVGGIVKPYVNDISKITQSTGGLINPVAMPWEYGRRVSPDGTYYTNVDHWWMIDVALKTGDTISCELGGYSDSNATAMVSIKNGDGDYTPVMTAALGSSRKVFTYTAETDCIVGLCSSSYYGKLMTPVIIPQSSYRGSSQKFAYKGINNTAVNCDSISNILQFGHTYIITPNKTDWKCATNSTSGQVNGFAIYYSNNGSTVYAYTRKIGQGKNYLATPIDCPIVVNMPENDGNMSDINVIFRASSDETLSFVVEDVTGELDSRISILGLNPKEQYLPRVATLKRKTPYGENPVNTPLVLMWFSDIHADQVNFIRAMQWKDAYRGYIDDIINCGDTVRNDLRNYDDDMTPYFANGGENILLALGNHDVCTGSYTLRGWDGTIPITQIYTKFTGRLSASTNIVQPQDASTYGYNFYYKDYAGLGVANSGIRLIVLDSAIKTTDITQSGSGASTADTEAYNTAQSQWLANVLEEARQLGYSVVCATHCGAQVTNLQTISGFAQDQAIGTSTHNSMQDYMLDAVDTFINAGGKFVTWLCGHVHIDVIGKVTAHPNQLLICITTASSKRDWLYGQMPNRTVDTKMQDAFNHIEIDPYYQEIRLLRVGCDVDNYGRRLDMVTIDYNNKTIKY